MPPPMPRALRNQIIFKPTEGRSIKSAETHPEDEGAAMCFSGTSNALDFLPLDRSGNGASWCTEQAEVHILEDEAASRAYLAQVWAEAMTVYRGPGI